MKKPRLILDLSPQQIWVGPEGGVPQRILLKHRLQRNNSNEYWQEVGQQLKALNLMGHKTVLGWPSHALDIRCESSRGSIPIKEALAAVIQRVQQQLPFEEATSTGQLHRIAEEYEAVVVSLSQRSLQDTVRNLTNLGVQVVSVKPRDLSQWLWLEGHALWLHLEAGACHLAGLIDGHLVHFEPLPENVDGNLAFALGNSYLDPSHPNNPRGQIWDSPSRHQALKEPFAQIIQRLSNLQRSLESRYSHTPKQLYFSGPLILWPEAKTLLSPWFEVQWPACNAPLSDLAAYGNWLALAHSSPLELLPKTPSHPHRFSPSLWFGPLLTTLGLAGISLWQLHQTSYQQQVQQSLQESLLSLQPAIEETQRINAQLDTLKRHLAVRDQLYALRIDWPEALASFMQQMPKHPGIGIESLQLQRGSGQPEMAFSQSKPFLVFSLQGKARYRSDLEALLAHYQKHPRYAVNFQQSTLAPNRQGWSFAVGIADQGPP